MSKQDKPTQALDKIEKQLAEIVRSEALGLNADLTALNVVDTGHFKSSWSMSKSGKWSWKIRNRAKYADILARGRRFVNGRYEGSDDWQNGLSPMLATTSKNIERRSNAVRE